MRFSKLAVKKFLSFIPMHNEGASLHEDLQGKDFNHHHNTQYHVIAFIVEHVY